MKTYTNHIYGEHPNLPKTANAASVVESDEETDMPRGDDMEQESSHENEGAFLDLKLVTARWILKIKECCKITQSTTEEIVQRVTDLNQYILSQVFLELKAAIAEAGHDVNTIPRLHDIFDPNGSFSRPFQGVETSHQLLTYCKKNLGFVVSRNTYTCIQVTFFQMHRNQSQ